MSIPDEVCGDVVVITTLATHDERLESTPVEAWCEREYGHTGAHRATVQTADGRHCEIFWHEEDA